MNQKIFQGYTVEQLDEQYNKRAEVPDHEDYFLRWQSDSEVARRRCLVREDVSYGAGGRELLDVFPGHQKGSPTVVFIHGGYWQALNKSYFSFIAPPLLDLGYAVVVLNYPLCPAVRLGDIVRSVRWAMVYLYRNIERDNGDPGAFHLVGHSAGGHLAAMLMATAWHKLDSSLSAPFIASGIGISGVYELEPIRHTQINRALKLDQSEINEFSPINLPPPASGELDLLVGGNESDEFKRQSLALERAWNVNGFTACCETLVDHNHFSVIDEVVSEDGVILNRLAGRVDLGTNEEERPVTVNS